MRRNFIFEDESAAGFRDNYIIYTYRVNNLESHHETKKISIQNHGPTSNFSPHLSISNIIEISNYVTRHIVEMSLNFLG